MGIPTEGYSASPEGYIMSQERYIMSQKGYIMQQEGCRAGWRYIAAGGYKKWCPTAMILPLKCARWHFENADGRENAGKSRPVDAQNAFRRAHLITESTLIHNASHAAFVRIF